MPRGPVKSFIPRSLLHPSAKTNRAAGASLAPPDLLGRLYDETQLGTLRLDSDVVAVHSAGETALRRQGELVERNVFGGGLDAALELVLVFHFAELGGHQAQHDRLALRQ